MAIFERFLNLCGPSAEEPFNAATFFGAMSFDEYNNGCITETESEYSDDSTSSQESTTLDGGESKSVWSLGDRTNGAMTVMTCPAALGRRTKDKCKSTR